ncbi:hypothetical protein [Streptomyces inusitatus]|nr:hypothetical protein [Streptomyces inusitatus]
MGDKIEEANGYDLGANETIVPATPPTPSATPEDNGSEDDSGNDSQPDTGEPRGHAGHPAHIPENGSPRGLRTVMAL